MVLILNGEVLADDDPRAVAYRQSQQSQPPQQPQHRNATVEDRQQVYMRRPNADAAAGSSSSGYERMGGPAGRFGGAGAAG